MPWRLVSQWSMVLAMIGMFLVTAGILFGLALVNVCVATGVLCTERIHGRLVHPVTLGAVLVLGFILFPVAIAVIIVRRLR